jgi:hypothetical protein
VNTSAKYMHWHKYHHYKPQTTVHHPEGQLEEKAGDINNQNGLSTECSLIEQASTRFHKQRAIIPSMGDPVSHS